MLETHNVVTNSTLYSERITNYRILLANSIPIAPWHNHFCRITFSDVRRYLNSR